ncbi:MAG: hypothetical protein J4G09_07890 [Proteobacteria bacterium]|nr:hypothetical protein [Pseudomonadota bacterium]
MSEKRERLRTLEMPRLRPRPLPPREEVVANQSRHFQTVKLSRGELGHWFHTPLDGGEWSEWGKRARPDAVGMTYMAVTEVCDRPVPEVQAYRRLMHSRFVKPSPRVPENLEERLAPKWGGAREIEEKYEVWIDDAGPLAEEALDRQWRPALSLRWEDMQRLPPPLERAFDQILTWLLQCEYFCSDAVGGYVGRLHYRFVEIKSYLAYEIFDYALHANALRKRLLSNGGGMGAQVEGFDAGLLEVCNEASQGFSGEVPRDFNAVVLAIDVWLNGVMLDLLRLAAAGARSEFDRRLLERVMQDCARHVSWGCKRIGCYLRDAPPEREAAERLHAVADRFEPAQVEGHLLNPRVLEPLALLLGGGPENAAAGWSVLREFWPQIGERWLARLDAVGLNRRDRCQVPTQPPF